MNALRKYFHTYTTFVDEFVYGANDGIITTFAVVSGAAGAGLGHSATVILGVANLVADGFSMGASSFLAIRTETDVDRAQGKLATDDEKRAVSRSLATFCGFVVAGSLPLLPFLFSVEAGREFSISAVAAATAFFVVGGVRSYVTRRSFIASGLEMLCIGGIASVLAYMSGYTVELLIRT